MMSFHDFSAASQIILGKNDGIPPQLWFFEAFIDEFVSVKVGGVLGA